MRRGGRSSCGVWGALFLCLWVTAACDSLSGPGVVLAVPPETGDGWATASAESVGLDPRPLQAMLDLIDNTENHLIHGVLIVKDGRLVLEEYWPGVDMEAITLEPVERFFGHQTRHYVASVSKSITSALVGIALDQGLLGSVDDLLFSYFPDYGDLMTEENREITLRHLLAFSSGFDWNEFVYEFGDPRDSHFQMFSSTDPVRVLLSRPSIGAPGEAFHYNSGDTNLLGEIVRRESGAENLAAFAEEHLFGPLGIEDYRWGRFPLADSVTFASGGAFLRPRDMAKLGALYLQGGVWNGRQVVSRAWVDASVAQSTALEGNYRVLYGYGYNWWLGRPPFGESSVAYFRAAGWGGQNVFVYPELDLVVVFTAGGYYEERPLSFSRLIGDFIFEAVSGRR